VRQERPRALLRAERLARNASVIFKKPRPAQRKQLLGLAAVRIANGETPSSSRFDNGKSGVTAGCAMAEVTREVTLQAASARRIGFIRFEANLCRRANGRKK
jgi:hypothetical protein